MQLQHVYLNHAPRVRPPQLRTCTTASIFRPLWTSTPALIVELLTSASSRVRRPCGVFISTSASSSALLNFPDYMRLHFVILTSVPGVAAPYKLLVLLSPALCFLFTKTLSLDYCFPGSLPLFFVLWSFKKRIADWFSLRTTAATLSSVWWYLYLNYAASQDWCR